jgi:hypothetical protein
MAQRAWIGIATLWWVGSCLVLVSSFQVPHKQLLIRPHQLAASSPTAQSTRTMSTMLQAFGKKKKEDLSFIETRDMTREEMLQLNAENERVMNAELVGMTVFSLIISLPLLYLAWVGLFADTAEIAMN